MPSASRELGRRTRAIVTQELAVSEELVFVWSRINYLRSFMLVVLRAL
jgi:hypothetical protein